MTVTSWSFIGFLVVASFIFYISPGSWRARCIFPATTLAFISLLSPSLLAGCALLGFVFLVWIASLAICKWPARKPRILVLFVILFVFGWMKSYEFLEFLPFAGLIPTTIGLSYVLIRAMQLLIDLAETPSLRPSPLTIFSFLTSWPSLISGPIQRYQDFENQLADMKNFSLDGNTLFSATQRIILGYFFVLVLGDATKHLWLGLQSISLEGPYPIAFGAAQGAFLVHLFFDFSGYMHIVIGAGLLFGLRLPENFDRPWQSKSFLEFWGRWHITMSNWFKTYVFNALLMWLVKRWPAVTMADIHGVAAFFVTFFLVGLWHGTTWAFVLCGLLLGTGASINHLYRTACKRKLGKKAFEALAEKRLYTAVAAALAFTYICFGVIPLWLSFDQIQEVLVSYGVSGLIISETCLFLMLLVFLPVVQSKPRVAVFPSASWRAPLVAGLQCIAIDAYLFLFPAVGGAFFYERF